MTVTRIPARPTAELAKISLPPCPLPGWLPAHAVREAAATIAVTVGYKDRAALPALKAVCWKIVRSVGDNDSEGGRLAAHIAAETLHILADYRR